MQTIRITRSLPAFNHPEWAMQQLIGCVITFNPERTRAILAEDPRQTRPGSSFLAVETAAFLEGIRQMNQPELLAHWEESRTTCPLIYLLASCYEVLDPQPSEGV